MMYSANLLFVLCFVFHGAAAFSVVTAPSTKLPSLVRLSSTSEKSSETSIAGESDASLARLAFPLDLPLTRIEGGNTVRTWKLPVDSERAQIVLKSNGRPLRAKVQLWIGPIRTTHTMDVDVQDGILYPYRGLIKFKKDIGPTIRVITSAEESLPVWAGVQVPTNEDSEKIGAFTELIWNTSPKTRIQGGPVSGGPGAVRVFPIPVNVDRVQVVCWSRDTSKKSLKAKIEVLQGPNTHKQLYDLQCGGGTQPFHCVFETPGEGWVIRMYNKKFIEDGLFEVAIVPFDYADAGGKPSKAGKGRIIYPEEGTRGPASSGGQSYGPSGSGGAPTPKRWYD